MNMKELFTYIEYELSQNDFYYSSSWNDYSIGDGLEYIYIYKIYFVGTLTHKCGDMFMIFTDRHDRRFVLLLDNFDIEKFIADIKKCILY